MMNERQAAFYSSFITPHSSLLLEVKGDAQKFED